MEAVVGAVLVGVFTLGGSIVTWLLSSRTSREAHQRQHSSDMALLDKRLEEERKARREEALRRHLREQAEPLYTFLNIMERRQGIWLLGDMLGGGEAKQRFEDHLHGLDPAAKAQIPQVAWDNLSTIWEELVAADTMPDERWQDLVKEYGGTIALIGDAKLQGMMMQLLAHVASGAQGHLSPSEVATLIRDAKARIAVEIVDPATIGEHDREAAEAEEESD